MTPNKTSFRKLYRVLCYRICPNSDHFRVSGTPLYPSVLKFSRVSTVYLGTSFCRVRSSFWRAFGLGAVRSCPNIWTLCQEPAMTEVLQIWHWPPGYHFKAHCSCHTTNFPAKYCQNVISVVEIKNIALSRSKKYPNFQIPEKFLKFCLTFGTVRSVRPSFGPLTDIFWIIIVRIIVYLTKNKVSRCPRGRTRAARYAQNSISWVVSLLKSWCHTLKSTTLGTVHP